MQTGTVIAIIIAVLILLAIWWFMTRAGRARAAQRYEESRSSDPALNSGASAAERGAPDGRSDGIVTESMGAGTGAGSPAGAAAQHPAAGAEPSTTTGIAGSAGGEASTAGAGKAGDNTFAGSQGSALDGTSVATAAAAAGATAVALAGAAAGASAGTASGAKADAAITADLDAGAAGHDEHGHPSAGSTAAQPPAPHPSTASRAAPAADDVARATRATGGGAASVERPRFDPANDGHPVPGDAPAEGASRSTAPDPHALPSARPALSGDFALDSGDTLVDVREMIKILNLRQSEAGRLDLAPEQFETVRQGQRDGIDDATLSKVAERLRRMIR